MAKRVLAERGVSIRLACLIFSVSDTCYRYKAKKNAENDQIPIKKGRITGETTGKIQALMSPWGFDVNGSSCSPPIPSQSLKKYERSYR